MAKYKGKGLQLRANNQTIALATDCSVNTTTRFVDGLTKDDEEGFGDEFDGVDWTASSNNLVGYNEDVTTELVYDSLMELQENGTPVDLAIEKMANASGKIPEGGWAPSTGTDRAFEARGGKAFIESISLNAPASGNATININFKGKSKLTRLTPAQS